MRRQSLASSLFLFCFLFFSSQADATRSRLMGMRGLSIVIEDESNMINLWGFSHNAAGFLSGKHSVSLSLKKVF